MAHLARKPRNIFLANARNKMLMKQLEVKFKLQIYAK